MLVNVTDDNFEKEVLQSDMPVLVDFWADWCGPCKKITPIIQDFAVEFKGRIKTCKGNMNDNGKVMSDYKISSLPAILIFKDGIMVKKSIGLRSKDDIQTDIESVL